MRQRGQRTPGHSAPAGPGWGTALRPSRAEHNAPAGPGWGTALRPSRAEHNAPAGPGRAQRSGRAGRSTTLRPGLGGAQHSGRAWVGHSAPAEPGRHEPRPGWIRPSGVGAVARVAVAELVLAARPAGARGVPPDLGELAVARRLRPPLDLAAAVRAGGAVGQPAGPLRAAEARSDHLRGPGG